MNQDNELPSLLQPGTVVPVVEDSSVRRWALKTRAYSTEGKNESFIARVPARVRPTTIAKTGYPPGSRPLLP